MRRCVKIRVVGSVQGVGYRKFVKKHANNLGLEGTIQNSDDGTVLLHVCGMSEKLDDLIDFLYKGTAKSKVEDVIVEPIDKDKNFRGIFRVIGEA